MKDTDFSSRFTGGVFVAAGLMLWLGWILLPVCIGVFFEPDVFGRIHDQFHLWIWIYRVHLFGIITSVLSVIALAAMVTDSPARVMVWPGTVVASLRVDTEYLTCLTRFGRVFGGLGLLVFAGGALRWKLLPAWNSGVAALVGLAAMALTMALPDQLSLYQPIFHVMAFWLVATGVIILRGGLRLASPSVL